MSFRINDIKNFVAASDCSTLIQASLKLEISQPALSESLKRLEADAGLILFYRSRTGVQLTPSGRIFLSKAKNVLQSFSDLEVDGQATPLFNGRSISIGCHATVAQYYLPEALANLKQLAPDFKVELSHDFSRNIQSEIQRGRIDVGIVINPVEVPDVVIQKLAADTVFVWSKTKGQNLDTLICNPDLFQTQSILKRWPKKPAKIIASESLELICQLVNAKVGMGIIPQRAAGLSKLRLHKWTQLPTFKDTIALVYRPEFGKIESEKVVLRVLKESILNHRPNTLS